MSDLERYTTERLVSLLSDQDMHNLLSTSELRSRLRSILVVLLRRGPSLSSKALLLLITEHASLVSDEERWSVCSVLLQRLKKMALAELFAFYPVCSDADERPKILHELIRRRDQLSSGDLVELLKLTCPKTPLAKECRQTLAELGLRCEEDKRRDYRTSRSLFGLSVSAEDELAVPGSWSAHDDVHCSGCRKQGITGGRHVCTACKDLNLCDACNQRVCSGASLRGHTAAHPVVVVHQPMHAFAETPQKDPTAPRQWCMELRFSRRTQQHLDGIKAECLGKRGTPGVPDATLCLLRDLPVGTGAKVYVSISPFDASRTHYIGALLSDSPFLSIEWAKLLYHYWIEFHQSLVIQTIRIGITLGSYDEVRRKQQRDLSVLASVSSFATSAVSSSSPSAASPAMLRPSVETGVVVCRGDVQRLKIDQKTTFKDVLQKATSNWRDRGQHELQDEEFSTFEPSELASSARGLIRYV